MKMKKRIILITVGFLLQLIQFFKTKAKLLTKTNLLNRLKELDCLSPSQLIKSFGKGQDYGLCIGKIFGSQKCTTIFQPKQSVVISKLFQLKSLKGIRLNQQIQHLVRIKRPTFMVLKDSVCSIPIYQTLSLPTKTMRISQRYSNYDKKSHINLVISLINIFQNYRIPYIAVSKYQERFLPEGTPVTLLGKFKRSLDGNISCQKPIAMGFNKQHIKDTLTTKIHQLNIVRYILVAGIAFCAGFLVKEIYNYCIKRIQQNNDSIQNYQQIFVKSKVCFNCKNQLSNFVLAKCGHLSMCKSCTVTLKICAECDKKGDQGLELYAC